MIFLNLNNSNKHSFVQICGRYVNNNLKKKYFPSTFQILFLIKNTYLIMILSDWDIKTKHILLRKLF